MGTNFYWIEEDTACPQCGRKDPKEVRLHIGKSSGGWCFSLNIHPARGIHTLDDWIERFQQPQSIIEDEYGDALSVEDMMKVITLRQGRMPFDERVWSTASRYGDYTDEADFHRRNHSERGPNNLFRHRLGDYCVGHGEGPWDLLVGEFS